MMQAPEARPILWETKVFPDGGSAVEGLPVLTVVYWEDPTRGVSVEHRGTGIHHFSREGWLSFCTALGVEQRFCPAIVGGGV
jgi:hypothetical protein